MVRGNSVNKTKKELPSLKTETLDFTGGSGRNRTDTISLSLDFESDF
jgi:hypothetical protein